MNSPHNAKPARSATSNALGAILGARFLCRECDRQHAHGSRLIDHCRHRFAQKHLTDDFTRWRADDALYHTRAAWRKDNRRWSEKDEETFGRLTTQLRALTIYEEFGIATLAELTLENGLELLLQRYATWRTETERHITDARTKAQDVLAELDALLPPPYPVGPPQYHAYYADPTWTPTAATQGELDRVANLTTPSLRLTIHRGSPSRDRAYLRWSPTRRDNADICQHIVRIFDIQLKSWDSRRLRRGRFRKIIDKMGLDPAFWSSIEITKRRFTLIAHHFSPAPLPVMTSDGQLVLPFTP